ncbi:MAG: RluA family pseudouridine synthase [Deltaproteobacteria bacterium]|nr:RluA family pseudouridine synthase [Deltaproteobacteria bacterium]
MNEEIFNLTVDADAAGMRLDALLQTRVDALSRARAAQHIAAGRVQVEGVAARRLKPALRVQEGWQVTVRLEPPPPSELEPWHDAELTIVYEDDDLLVIDKPAGLVVHPGAGHPDETLVNALLAHLPELDEVGAPERPGLVHRIDKDTSGLLVVSKTPVAHARLAADFAKHTIERRYVAVALGKIAAERFTVESGHGRHPRDRRRFSGKTREGSERRAVSHVYVRARSAMASLVVVTLETGRTHQIRMHLAERGHPIVGDVLYGGVRNHPRTPATIPEIAAIGRIERQALHAYALGFHHPSSGEMMRFHAAMPDDMAALVQSLFGADAAALPSLEHTL